MKVFATGGTGYIGQAVVRALARARHEVTTLTRSAGDRKAPTGVELHQGDIRDPGSWRYRAAEHDALVHLAFEYSTETVAADRTAVETLVAAAGQGVPRQVVYTSGCWVLGDSGPLVADEATPLEHPAPLVAWRPAHEMAVLGAAREQLVTSVIRPGLVYGGAGGLTGAFFKSALERGAATLIGEGNNH